MTSDDLVFRRASCVGLRTMLSLGLALRQKDLDTIQEIVGSGIPASLEPAERMQFLSS